MSSVEPYPKSSDRKKCLFIGMCHVGGVKKFLEEFSKFPNFYESQIFANWELMKNNSKIPLKTLREADLVIYQPLGDEHGCYSTKKSNPDSFFNLLRDDAVTISIPRLHNNSLWPIYHRTNSKVKGDYYGTINNKVTSRAEFDYLYDSGAIDFDFQNRFDKNCEISRAKEAICDVKIVDFILANLRKQKLFLTQDHPTSFLFNEVTRQVCNKLDIEYDLEKAGQCHENFSGTTDSTYGRSDAQYPISRYAAKHFGFEYRNDEAFTESDQFYKSISREFLQSRGDF